MLSSVLVIVPFVAGVFATNDWNTPCVNGQCSYDLPTTNTSGSGTLKIWGSENAISDITPAAGWQILDCNQTALSQNIRLVCTNDDPSSLCGHLYQNTGAVNKIVRLPQNCGANAFARVAKSWVPEDQSIPSSIKARLVRRGGNPPQVKALAIDTNFDAVDPSKTGKVNFAINAANVPGAATDIQIPSSRRSRVSSRVFPRGLLSGLNSFDKDKTFSIDPITLNKSANLFNTSEDCGPVSASLSVDINANAAAQPSLTLSVAGTFIPPSISSFEAVAGMTAQISGGLTVSAELSGHVDSGAIPLLNIGIPGFDFPEVLTLGPSFQVNAQFVGDVELSMDLSVGMNFDVNNAQLVFPPNSTAPDSNAFSIGDTPLSLSATPNVQATGTLTAHLIPSLNLGVTAFGGKANANLFIAVDTSAALVLSLDASAQINQTIGTNSTESDPQSNNGTITSLLPNSTQSAPSTVITSTSSDFNTTLGTNSTESDPQSNNGTITSPLPEESSTPLLSNSTQSASATVITSISSDSNGTFSSLLPDSSQSFPTTTTAPSVISSAAAVVSSAVETDTAALALNERDDPTVSGSFGGCVQVNGGINVNAGAQGDFFNLFNDAASVSLFTKNFQIFQKCFGNGASVAPAPTKRWIRRRVSTWGRQRRSLFSCPSPGLSAPESVADETVSSSSVTTD